MKDKWLGTGMILLLAVPLAVFTLLALIDEGDPLPAETVVQEPGQNCPGPEEHCAYLPFIPRQDQPPFYAMDVVPTEDLAQVAQLEIDVVGQVFPHDGSPADWLNRLDQAEAHGLRVIAWLWPQGWEWAGDSWDIDPQADLFVRTVAGHPALLAVYALHEPYWQGCWGCGYTTAQQQALYTQIKSIARVPIYSAVDSMAFWTAQGPETAFADGICDYCLTWYYPFLEGTYDRDEFLDRLHADLDVARDRAPNSRIIWAMQAFAQNPPGYRMPDAAEMDDLAGEVYKAGVDGAIWYVWTFNALYDDFLSNHAELLPIVEQIYHDHVAPQQ
jgi:hypothetical protein